MVNSPDPAFTFTWAPVWIAITFTSHLRTIFHQSVSPTPITQSALPQTNQSNITTYKGKCYYGATEWTVKLDDTSHIVTSSGSPPFISPPIPHLNNLAIDID